MILHEASVPFGGKVTDIVTEEFTCVVSTAKEGVFKGLSTMVAEVQGGQGRPCAKIIYAGSTRKRDRLQFHEVLVGGLDEAGENGVPLREAIDSVVTELKSRGVVTQAINFA